jgi:acetate kinase
MGPSVSIKCGPSVIIAKVNVCNVIIVNPPAGYNQLFLRYITCLNLVMLKLGINQTTHNLPNNNIGCLSCNLSCLIVITKEEMIIAYEKTKYVL